MKFSWWAIDLPRTSSRGSARSISAASPPTMKVEVPAAAFILWVYTYRETLTVVKAQAWEVNWDNLMDLAGPLLVLGVALL